MAGVDLGVAAEAQRQRAQHGRVDDRAVDEDEDLRVPVLPGRGGDDRLLVRVGAQVDATARRAVLARKRSPLSRLLGARRRGSRATAEDHACVVGSCERNPEPRTAGNGTIGAGQTAAATLLSTASGQVGATHHEVGQQRIGLVVRERAPVEA